MTDLCATRSLRLRSYADHTPAAVRPIRRTSAILVAFLVLILSGCGRSKTDATPQREEDHYKATERAFDSGVTPLIADWARLTVTMFFGDLSSIRTQSDETEVRSHIADLESTKTLAATLCERLKSIDTLGAHGPEKVHDARIGSAVYYVDATTTLSVASNLLGQISGADPSDRDRLLANFISNDPADSGRAKAAINALKRLDLLGPTGEVLTPPGARDQRVFDNRLFDSDLAVFQLRVSYFVAPLEDQIKPCFPRIGSS